jgi:signal transduction histidine kinase
MPGASEPNRGPGIGLLSRFLGAIFLILVCGLWLLDHALLRANHDQTNLDAQAASLLTEAFLNDETSLLARIGAATRWNADSQAPALSGDIVELLQHRNELRGVWLVNPAGRTTVIARVDTGMIIPLAREQTNPDIRVKGDHRRVRSIVLRQQFRDSAGRVIGQGGFLIDPQAIAHVLSRLVIPTRVTLTINAGMDTVASLGEPESSQEALTEALRTIRLPTGGTWVLVSSHALTSRSLRWILWALGILGTGFLALGLLREQQRALQAAGRSTELERLYSDVKRANQAKSEFLANVSHELRTPLNAIVGFVELLREGFYGDLSPRQVPPVDRIAASATHLRHLVDQVLDIAKIAAGRLEVHTETIVLRPFVLNIASELESLVSEKGLAFSITVGASLPRVRTDPTHLRQILINLIGNAVKYTHAGTISIRARLVNESGQAVNAGQQDSGNRSVPRSGNWIALQTVDTGVGIAKADLERIFDEFEQVNAGPRSDSLNRGTGLGLAISRRLARLLGGEISVESELGRGSTFIVWIPVNAADMVRDPIVTPSEAQEAIP